MTPLSKEVVDGFNLIQSLPIAEEHYYTVSGELKKNLAFIQAYKSLPELEVELFDLCKEYQMQFTLRGVDLSSLKRMYPLTQLQNYRDDLRTSETLSLAEEVDKVLEQTPWALTDYKWIDRVFRFLNLLVMKWELIDANNYRYRNDTTVPTDPVRLHKYKMRQIWVFPLETVWLACIATDFPLRNKLPASLVSLARVVQLRSLELIRTVASLNHTVDYKLNPDIREFLGAKSEEEAIYHTKKRRIKPDSGQTLCAMGERVDRSEDFHEVIKAVGQPTMERGLRHKPAKIKPGKNEAKIRYERARQIGFHLLELPAVLCKCMEHDFHTVNLRLKSQLQNYDCIFRVFECQMLRLAEPNLSAFGTCDPCTKSSRRGEDLNITHGDKLLQPSVAEQRLP